MTLNDGEIEIDLASRKVTTSRGTQQLTRTEARLLQVLAASVDRIVTTDHILDRVWAESDGADPSYVWVTVRRLRRKLETDPDHPRHLLTERGLGYRLSSTASAAS
jgi:two-component system KDP operon response regulator KdpE